MDYTATLFRPISLKPCRDRRPRRSEKQQILLFMWLPIIAGCKLKILSFFGPSRTPVPTGKKFKPHQHTDTERKPYRFRVVEFSLRLVSQGDLPSANSRSNMPPECYSSPSRRFATSTPTIKFRLWCQREKRLRSFACFRADDRWSPLRSNKASTSIASGNLFVFGPSGRRSLQGWKKIGRKSVAG